MSPKRPTLVLAREPAQKTGRTASDVLAALGPALQGQGLSLALAERQHPAPLHPVLDEPLAPLIESLLLPGAAVELCALPGAGALSLALRLLKETLRPGFEARTAQGRRVRPSPWLCALDCGRQLHAPAVSRLGVPLERLVVIAPTLADVPRLAVRAARSGIFAGLVVDLTEQASLATLPVPLRRMTLAAEDCGATVFLLTSPHAARPSTLPVAARAEIGVGEHGTVVDIVRHRHGVMPRLEVPLDEDVSAQERAAFHQAPLPRPRLPVRPPTKARGRR